MTDMILPFLAAAALQAPASRAELRRQILAADDVLFERAFNQCDLGALEDILLPDARMIHDQAGIDEGREAFMKPVRENICKGSGPKPIRKRNEASIEIYPLYENGALYGAIELGRHEFYLREDSKPLRLTNRARFVIVWAFTDDGWKLKTTLSWDHLNPNENGPLDADVLEAGFGGTADAEAMLAAHGIQAESVAVVRSGKIVEERALGMARDGEPAAVSTIYHVASLSKPVSALVAIRLADAGLFDLDRPLAQDYIDPDIAASPYGGRVTARMVLSHTSGLPNWRYLDDQGGGTLRFLYPPGERYNYSGEGFEWLRHAIEARTGETFEALARRYVFEPAGMLDTSYIYPAAKAGRIAARYDAKGEQVMAPHEAGVNAAASLTTTVGDYARFVAFVMDGAGLSRPMADALFSPQVRIDEHKSFALGWQILHDAKGLGAVFQHSGADVGVRSLAVMWPNAKRAIVILSNSENAIPTWGIILREEFGEDGAQVVQWNR